MREQLLKKVHEAIGEFVNSYPPKFSNSFITTGLAIYGKDEINSVVDSLLEGRLGLSKHGQEFEKKFGDYVNMRHCLLVNSGSSASLIGLEGLKDYFGSDKNEVITTACGFPTTINPIIQLGLKPVFVDVDETYNTNPEMISRAISKKTKGIVFTHTLGNPARVEEIMSLAKSNNLFVLEDCCDAYGSKYNGKMCGSFGDVSTFSFYPAHNITLGGEGGAVATNNSHIAKSMRSFRDWGRDCSCEAGEDNKCGNRFNFKLKDTPYDHKYIYSKIGYNLKPTEMQAAMGLVQLEKIEDFNNSRRSNYNHFKELFSSLEDHFKLPEINPGADPVFFGLPLVITNPSLDRQDLVRFLNDNSIGTRYVFGGNLLYHPAYNKINYGVSGELIQTDNILKNAFWIGIHPGITDSQIEYIGDKFNKYISMKDDITKSEDIGKFSTSNF